MALIGSLDTNVLLRLLLNDVPDQHEATKKLLDSSDGQFLVSDIAFSELVFVLDRYYGFSRNQVTEAGTGLMQLRQIDCNRTLLEKSLRVYLDHPALSFEDCYLSTCARLNQAEPLWTFDKKLASQTPSARLISV